jgi:F-type H+-transporting ATPase subunit b
MEIEWSDPRIWVALAFVITMLLSARRAASLVASALDSRSARIKAELDEARRLREEAEQVLTLYKQKQAEFTREAQSILAKARDDANHLSAHAEADLEDALNARTKHALDKIGQAEATALAEVRGHVADITIAAARKMIVDQVASLPADELIKLAIHDIERKIH